MAEQPAQERTEKPTPRRLEKAQAEGQVPRSQELLAATVLLSGAAALAWMGGGLGRHAISLMGELPSALSFGPLTEGDAVVLLRTVLQRSVVAVLPVMLLLLGPVLLVGGMQARGVMSAKPITPDLSRISPLRGFKRLFGAEGLFTLFKALVKVAVLGLITWLALEATWPRIAILLGGEAAEALTVTRSVSLKIVVFTGIAFLGLSLVDYLFASWRHEKQLRMTRQEIVQENRESEGDPLLKSRMRSLAQQLTRRRMLQKVADADVVIVNPTNIAVAIKYDADEASAPIVLAMGQRKLAERIRTIAHSNGIPLVRNVPVAKALIATAKVGQPIPPALYGAIAEILAFVYRQSGRIPASLAGRR
jgi:flagellar biosynthetic protein FlhB